MAAVAGSTRITERNGVFSSLSYGGVTSRKAGGTATEASFVRKTRPSWIVPNAIPGLPGRMAHSNPSAPMTARKHALSNGMRSGVRRRCSV